MSKVVGVYARVSTIDQHPENQINELKRYVDARGWTMYNGEPFVDHGISGAKGVDKRPALKALMDAVHRRRVKAVLVWDLSRFARSMKQLVMALDTFRELDCEFISYQQGIDTTTATGRLTFGIIAALAEFEREMIRERTLAGMIEARAKGKQIGRPKMEFDLDLAKANINLSVRKLATLLNVSPTTSARIKTAFAVPKGSPENGVLLRGKTV